jgi:Family of unknown function (DUF5995)
MPETVDDVLAALDGVVAESRAAGSRVGFFAALYRKVTAKINEGIEGGFFDDGDRLTRVDVGFAARYLEALRRWQAGGVGATTRSWALAFRAVDDARPIVLQHLLVAINAHINLDLGVAAAEAAPGDLLPGLRRDFDRVNEILALFVAQVERELGEVSPLLGLLDHIGGRHDDEVVRFSVDVARTDAWRFATELAPLDRSAWGGPIGARDAQVARLARLVLNPGPLLTAGLLVIRAVESSDVRHVIDVLATVEEPDLETVDARVREERAPPSHQVPTS